MKEAEYGKFDSEPGTRTVDEFPAFMCSAHYPTLGDV
jgi:hypothetical protein